MLKSSSYSNVFSLFLNSSFPVDQEVREAHAISINSSDSVDQMPPLLLFSANGAQGGVSLLI